MIALLTAFLLLPAISRRISSRLPASLTNVTHSLKLYSPAIYPLLIVFLCLGAIRYQLALAHINPGEAMKFSQLIIHSGGQTI